MFDFTLFNNVVFGMNASYSTMIKYNGTAY